jgi:hypothetical protein
MKLIKYLLVIPDGIGIRNFFCTRFIDLLLESGEVCVWHALPEQCLAPFQRHWGSRVEWEKLPAVQDPIAERLLRQAKIYAQLYWQQWRDNDIQLQRQRPPGRVGARLVDIAARSLGRCFANSRRIIWLDRMHQSTAARASHLREFETFLRRWRPDVVFCSHQRALKAVPALLAARKLGSQTATFIYSWDNLPKGRMPVAADHYFVWSDFMKTELLSYYPDVTDQRVRVVGTPQFENYQNSDFIWAREAFFRCFNLDPLRPVVCYSGDDFKTSPHDPIHLADLAEAMRLIPSTQRPQILFRRSPVDRTGRYDETLKRFPEIRVSDPLWQDFPNGDWSQVVPTREDVGLLVNVVAHCDLVINVGSTMAMDFAAYDKPAIYIAYNPAGTGSHWNIHDLYRLPHFKTAHELQPIYWAFSANELGDLVVRALRHPKEKSEARRAWLHRHVMQPMDEACQRCANALLELAVDHRRSQSPGSTESNMPADDATSSNRSATLSAPVLHRRSWIARSA